MVALKIEVGTVCLDWGWTVGSVEVRACFQRTLHGMDGSSI